MKSLVVKHKDGTFLFALIPGDRQISWPKLRELIGVNKLSMPSAEAALAATGYERGTITPVGADGDWPVYADESIRGKRISMGAGAHGRSAFLDADSLIAAYRATVADIEDFRMLLRRLELLTSSATRKSGCDTARIDDRSSNE